MHTAPLAVTLALAAALSPSPAGATGASDFSGACQWTLLGDPAGVAGGGFTGQVAARFALYSTDAAANPVSADVTCTLVHRTPDGTVLDVSEATFSGTGVVAGRAPSRVRGDADMWDLWPCLTVDFTSDDTPTYHSCAVRTTEQIPPAAIQEAIDAALFGQVPGSRAAFCETLGDAGPLGLALGLSVNENGDVQAGYRTLYDC